jgi:hypothetical protein
MHSKTYFSKNTQIQYLNNGKNDEISPIFDGFFLLMFTSTVVSDSDPDQDPAKVSDPYGSGSTTLPSTVLIS